MCETKFNLLDEPWIRVIDKDCNVQELSLLTVFERAQEFVDLCGELPTQDVAMLRLLLAVLHPVVSRYDVQGNPSPFVEPSDAMDRWQEIWDSGHLPTQAIAAYLEQYRERFWMVHPERPFWQVPTAAGGTAYKAAKLNGVLSESSHKVRLFPMVAGEQKESVSYAEAARWLLCTNAYDDAALKKGTEETEKRRNGQAGVSVQIGWLGQLGLVFIKGNNLFETLMLNLMLRKPNGDLWDKECPTWEIEQPNFGERVQIPFPTSLSTLYTMQCRRIQLLRKNDTVVGFLSLGGECVDTKNGYQGHIEPMTKWRVKTTRQSQERYPGVFSAERKMWREFASILPQEDQATSPSIIGWVRMLKEGEDSCLNKRYFIHLQAVSVSYSSAQKSAIEEIYSDCLSLNASLLSNFAVPWRAMITHAVEFSEKVSNSIYYLGKDLTLAKGGEGDAAAKEAKSSFFFRIDEPFRQWLHGIDPETDDTDDTQTAWEQQVVRIARTLAQELVAQAGTLALVGHIKGKENSKQRYSSAKAMNAFNRSLARLLQEGR